MKALLYFRTLVVVFKQLFTKEAIKQILIGSLIGQLIGWMFVLGLFLGCTKTETVSVAPPPVETPAPVCEVPAELKAELETRKQQVTDLQNQMDTLIGQIDHLEKLIDKVQNSNARAQIEEHVDGLRSKYENLAIEHGSVLFNVLNLQILIDGYGCAK